MTDLEDRVSAIRALADAAEAASVTVAALNVDSIAGPDVKWSASGLADYAKGLRQEADELELEL